MNNIKLILIPIFEIPLVILYYTLCLEYLLMVKVIITSDILEDLYVNP